ncbi:MAG: hypothetical protein P8076_07700 [Gammaproteobacteria bacterium]
MKRIALFLVPVLLGGCQALARNDAAYSRSHDLPAGSRVVLDRALKMPVGRRSLHVQHGEVTRYRNLNIYDGYCELVLKTLSDTPRVIKPDTFTVTRFHQQIDYTQSSMRTAPNLRLVAMGGGNGDAEGDMGDVPFQSVMRLHSPRQPDVERLTCTIWATPSEGDYLTVKEMQDTLKGVFTLKAAPSTGAAR